MDADGRSSTLWQINHQLTGHRRVFLRAISVLQPWASALAHDIKRIETRSWGTKYRGLLAIHASKTFDIKTVQSHLDLITAEGGKRSVAALAQHTSSGWPVGAVIAVGRLVECEPMPSAPDCLEHLWGDFGPGRWGWQIEDVQLLQEPVPMRGQLGVWIVGLEAGQVIAEQLLRSSSQEAGNGVR